MYYYRYVKLFGGMLMSGLYVSLEGIDGSGKTDISQFLSNILGAELVREPSQAPTGKLLRSVLKGEEARLSELTMAYLFASDRAELIDSTIKPFLAAGKTVISDRCFLSTVCYQGAVGSISSEDIIRMHELIRKPDLVIILDISVQTSIERVLGRNNNREIYEEISILEKVKAKYDSLDNTSFPGTKIVRVDSEGPLVNVVDECHIICKGILE